MVVPVLDIKPETNLFIARFLYNKFHKIYELATTLLNKRKIILLKVEMLTGLLFFCAKVVRLSWVFMRLF